MRYNIGIHVIVAVGLALQTGCGDTKKGPDEALLDLQRKLDGILVKHRFSRDEFPSKWTEPKQPNNEEKTKTRFYKELSRKKDIVAIAGQKSVSFPVFVNTRVEAIRRINSTEAKLVISGYAVLRTANTPVGYQEILPTGGPRLKVGWDEGFRTVYGAVYKKGGKATIWIFLDFFDGRWTSTRFKSTLPADFTNLPPTKKSRFETAKRPPTPICLATAKTVTELMLSIDNISQK